jgi:hypothetical protein
VYRRAKSNGAKLVRVGERANVGTGKRHFVKRPSRRRETNMRIAREEIIGPAPATYSLQDAEDPPTVWPPRPGRAT